MGKSLVEQFKHPRLEERAIAFERFSGDVPYRMRRWLETPALPTLVIATRLDPVHPYDYGTFLANRIAGATSR